MAEKLAPIATQVVYEDEYVRVWNQVVPAGGRIERHVHTNDYFLLNVTGHGPIEVAFHEGTAGSSVSTFRSVRSPARQTSFRRVTSRPRTTEARSTARCWWS
jgi:hypothetical protein